MVVSNFNKIKPVIFLATVQIIALVILDLIFTRIYWSIGATVDAPKWTILGGLSHLDITSYILLSVSVAILFLLLQLTLFKNRQIISFGYICMFSIVSSFTFFALFLLRITDSRLVSLLVMFTLALFITDGVTLIISKLKKN